MRTAVLSLYHRLRRLQSGSGLNQVPALRAMNDTVARLFRRPSVEIDGRTIYLDPRDALKLSLRGTYEPLLTEYFRDHVRPGEVVVDIGANLGYFSLLFSQLVGDRGQVHCIEPDPDNFALLLKNLSANNCRNATAIQAAAADRTGSIRLYLCNDMGDHRTYDSGDGRRSIEVPATRVDDVLERHPTVDWIKLDAQGAEPAILEGMRELIARSQRVRLAMEFWPYGLEKFGVSGRHVLAMLEEMGFIIYRFGESNRSIDDVQFDRLLAELSGRRKHANLLCVKGVSRDEATRLSPRAVHRASAWSPRVRCAS